MSTTVSSADLALSILDLDKDGKISRKDFELVVAKNDYPKKEDNDRLRQAIGKMCDVIGLAPGVALSFEEYSERVQQVLSDPSVESAIRSVLEAYFDCLDRDKNGTISPKEYEIFIQGLGKAADASETKAAFDSIDKNHNGKIEKSEFIDYAYEFFFTGTNELGSDDMAGARCCCYRPPCRPSYRPPCRRRGPPPCRPPCCCPCCCYHPRRW